VELMSQHSNGSGTTNPTIHPTLKFQGKSFWASTVRKRKGVADERSERWDEENKPRAKGSRGGEIEKVGTDANQMMLHPFKTV